jgi:hypothetical protein
MTTSTHTIPPTPTNQPTLHATRVGGCCGPVEQGSCCAPSQKAECCKDAEAGTCGCKR